MGAKLFVRSMAFVIALACSPALAQTPEGEHPANSADNDIVAQMAALATALKALDAEKFEKLQGAPAQATALAEALAKVSYGFPTAINNARATQISDAADKLTTALNGASATTKKFLQQDGTASESLTKLIFAIQGLELTAAGRVVRVIEAKFGDTPEKPVIRKRWCDATSYMRNRCDRQLKCSLEANYQDQVCGFNPAQSADPRSRGLYVDYECVSNVEANFVGTYGVPGTPKDSELLKNADPSKYVVLRGNGSLVCGAPVK